MGFYGKNSYEIIKTFPSVQVTPSGGETVGLSPDMGMVVQSTELIQLNVDINQDSQTLVISHQKPQEQYKTDTVSTVLVKPEQKNDNAIQLNFGDQICLISQCFDTHGHILSNEQFSQLVYYDLPILKWEKW